MNLAELYNALGRKVNVVAIANDQDERVWELLALDNQKYIELKAFLDIKSKHWGTYRYHGTETGAKVVSVASEHCNLN